MEKGENSGYQHRLLFPQCFRPCKKSLRYCVRLSDLLPAGTLDFEEFRIFHLVEG